MPSPEETARLAEVIAQHGPPPEWMSWGEAETHDYLNEFREQVLEGDRDALVCDRCDSYIFDDVATPPWADREIAVNLRWVRVTESDDVMLRRRYANSWSYGFSTSYEMDVYYDRLDESYSIVCTNCHEQLSEDNSDQDEDSEYGVRGVHDYGFRPTPVFFNWEADTGTFTDSRRPYLSELGKQGVRSPASADGINYVQVPYFGIELEMTRNESGARSIQSAADLVNNSCGSFAYLKWDGSVDNGFELVTHPQTLEAFQNRNELWDTLTTLRREGWRSWNSHSSCGLHIHLNNSSFASYGHAMRFLMFVYKNREPLVRFAGRDSHYARFAIDEFVQRQYHDGWNDDGSPIYRNGTIGDVVKKKQVNDNRYLAVNCRNTHTYELRFFRGNLNPKAVLACIEFVACLHEYTQNLTSHDCLVNRALTWRPFLAFVRRNSTVDGFRYRNLYERLTMARRNGDEGFINTAGAE
jgi:hypothetical protein